MGRAAQRIWALVAKLRPFSNGHVGAHQCTPVQEIVFQWAAPVYYTRFAPGAIILHRRFSVCSGVVYTNLVSPVLRQTFVSVPLASPRSNAPTLVQRYLVAKHIPMKLHQWRDLLV